MSILVKDSEYKQWLGELKQRIRQSQIKAAIKVNSELLRLYWDLGHDIVVRQMDAAWGSSFFEQLSKDLMLEFPDMKGFSIANLRFTKRFYLFYSQDISIRYQLGSELETTNFQQLGRELQQSDNNQNVIRQQLVSELEVTNPQQLGGKSQQSDNKKNTNRQQLVDDLQSFDNKQNIICQQVADELENHMIFQIPWGHHVQIITKCKSVKEALFYVQALKKLKQD